MPIFEKRRFRGCLLGLAAGDAVGTTVEFAERGSFRRVTDMVGGGPFQLRPGQWTDDTSMALCLATSLVERGEFDAKDQMTRYLRWREEGYLSSTGTCFDVGRTVSQALARFRATGQPFQGSRDPQTAGNGSIMRLAPVPMFFVADPAEAVRRCAESSRTTHGADECVEACELLGAMLCQALLGANRDAVLAAGRTLRPWSPAIGAIARGDYWGKSSDDISAGGYVVASLEAAVWCFATTDSYRDAILAAANLGEDADTTAAVCGQLAGAYYGASGIPGAWLDRLKMYAEISQLADRLFDHAGRYADLRGPAANGAR